MKPPKQLRHWHLPSLGCNGSHETAFLLCTCVPLLVRVTQKKVVDFKMINQLVFTNPHNEIIEVDRFKRWYPLTEMVVGSSHKRIGDHMTKPKSRWLKWDCINAPYAVSLHMLFHMLYVVLYGAFLWVLHFSYENKIKLIRHCGKTTLAECFLICKSKIKQKPLQTFTLLIITW